MHILFVCTGNTCRSAMAEGLLKKELSENGIKNVTVSSVGTSASPSFKVPKIVLKIMKENEIDLSSHKSTPMNEDILLKSDTIFVMAKHHRGCINSLYPKFIDKVFMFKEYLGESGDVEISDPMGHSDEIYMQTALLLKGYIKKLVEMEKSKWNI